MKVLVDTSVWIEHLRKGAPDLANLLEHDLVLTHSAVIGELACGSLKNRKQLLEDLAALPRATEASPEEVLKMISAEHLAGKGLGWIDAQLLASARLSGAALLTRDRRLGAL